jgi:hypothetical protein
MSADSKLYRVFVEAGKAKFTSQRALATNISPHERDEFSYVRNGRKEYSSWQSVVGFVSLLVRLGLLDDNLQPFVPAKGVTLKGFGRTLAEKAVAFADAHGFGLNLLDKEILGHMARRPAVLPTPFNLYDSLEPKCNYRSFYRIIRLKCLEDDPYGLQVRNRPVVASRATIEFSGG